MFNDTDTGIILLDFILLGMGLILSPLLWGVFTRLGKIGNDISECTKTLAQSHEATSAILRELSLSHIRDTEMKGHLKSMDEKINRYIKKD